MIDHIIKTSRDRGWIISIMYQKGSEITFRNIKVVAVDGENIKPFCYLREEQRVFKRGNILAASYLNECKNRKAVVNAR